MIVEKGTYLVLQKPQEDLESEKLGACVALGAVDDKAQVIGLWVFVLPASRLISKKEQAPNELFAEEGLDEFLAALEKEGAHRKRLKLVAAGGARFLKAPTIFDLGGINASMLLKLLKERGITLLAQRLGKPFPAQIRIEPSGKISVKIAGKEEESW